MVEGQEQYRERVEGMVCNKKQQENSLGRYAVTECIGSRILD